MNWQSRSWRRPVWKCVSLFRVTHSEAEAPARMTVYLSTRLGAAAAQLILKEDYGYMVGMVNGKCKKVPLGEVAGKLKMVSPDDQIIRQAKLTGISFGD